MSDENVYRQCETRSAGRIDIVWLPNHLAKLGGKFVVKETGETWTVTAVYTARTLETLNEERHAQRKFEGDLEPHR